jgi:Mg-chelatase subunit ChlD
MNAQKTARRPADYALRCVAPMSVLQLATFAARLPEIGTSPRHAFLQVDIVGRGPALAQGVTDARTPLCMALAIDASSSMRGGRFAMAVQAARDVLDALGSEDRFAVVSFDRVARTVCAPGPADLEGRNEARRALDRLSTNTGTNLSAAWRECEDNISRWMAPDAARKIILLTDGLPSHGDVEPDSLRRLVAEGAKRSIETNVVGIGSGIDEKLCAALATAGGGRFHFLRDAAQVATVIAYEVEGARRLVATDVSLSLGFTGRILRAEVMHKLPCRPDGRVMEVSIGPIAANTVRTVLLQIEVDDPTTEVPIATVFARGNSTVPKLARATNLGFALGARSHEDGPSGDPRELCTEKTAVSLGLGFGGEEARKKIATTVLWMRTVAEVRSAWDAVEARDPEAVTRRLARAMHLRKVLTESGLVSVEDREVLPNLEVLQSVMLGPKDAGQEQLKRTWHSIAYNTGMAQNVAIPEILNTQGVGDKPRN